MTNAVKSVGVYEIDVTFVVSSKEKKMTGLEKRTKRLGSIAARVGSLADSVVVAAGYRVPVTGTNRW